ncbi:MAG: 4-(cytidine 5'-diphospho)-2-C-methyl-D-erythritol kinase [Thermodesulfovibrio sp.]|nr:4-(cytidine 5'-diphospho)-2-C-methyl-D-erythritol kinase [Thermodesulfovibrio sp.]
MIVVKAPAKINWFLQVAGRRDDGYHDIISIMQSISLHDTLVFEEHGTLELASAMDLPARENLVYRAAELLQEAAGCSHGALITLQKSIPSAAGLGGGSSDAAAALIGLNRLWKLGLHDQELRTLGSKLGSDIPFFIGPPCALVAGRGEKVTPLPAGSVRSHALLLLKPDIGIATAWAYGNYRMLTKKTVDIKLFCQALGRSDFSTLKRLAFNDLEDAVISRYQVIAALKARLLEQGAEFSLMSGSGSTVFGVFRSPEDARRASESFTDTWSCAADTIVDGEQG